MADLDFTVKLLWRGTGSGGEGTAELAKDVTVRYSAPQSMGGKGVGTSPEELLIAAVSSCYSGTLFGLLKRQGLAVEEVRLRAVGTVTGYPSQTNFAQLCVHPTIYGGNPNQVQEYQQAAETARDNCFIGKTIAGNVSYKVGEVIVLE